MVIENRQLRKLQYFTQLQLEYIATLVRLHIFDSEKDKLFYTQLLEKKKVKINDIVYRRNSDIHIGDSILNSIDKYHKLLNRFLGEGYPNFTYNADGKYIDVFARLDFRKYYAKGIDVTVFEDGIKTNGTVSYSDFDKKEITVKIGKEKKIFHCKNVKRNLCISF